MAVPIVQKSNMSAGKAACQHREFICERGLSFYYPIGLYESVQIQLLFLLAEWRTAACNLQVYLLYTVIQKIPCCGKTVKMFGYEIHTLNL